MDFPGSVIEMVQRQVAATGRIGATGIVRVPDLSAAVAEAASATAPSDAVAPMLDFQEAGWVVAMYGQERTGTQAKYAATEMRLQINGSRDFVTSGLLGGAFFPFLGLFGPSVHWFPVTRRVEKRDKWQFTFRNFDTGAVANPTVGLAFLSDVEIAKIAQQLATP